MINETYEKWQSSPVLMTLADKPISVWKIPFPAITICPVHKAKKVKVDSYNCLLWKMGKVSCTDEERKIYEALNQVCFPDELRDFESVLKREDIYTLLENISFPIHDELIPNKVLLVELISTEIMTEQGLCKTFNILNSSELLQENV
jgi:acid-sensing ion channel, other